MSTGLERLRPIVMAKHNAKPSIDAGGSPTRKTFLLAIVVLLLLTFLMFADVLFSSTRVLSNVGCDLALQFLAWRDFGFRELRHGNLALWNPHVYAGEPFLGSFQSALLYPPNWLYLVLPLGPATNWQIALHIFLGGLFTVLSDFAWRADLRGLPHGGGSADVLQFPDVPACFRRTTSPTLAP